MFQCQGISQQEIVEAELASVIQQREALQQDLDAASERGAQISALHAKRDQILGKYQHFEYQHFEYQHFEYQHFEYQHFEYQHFNQLTFRRIFSSSIS